MRNHVSKYCERALTNLNTETRNMRCHCSFVPLSSAFRQNKTQRTKPKSTWNSSLLKLCHHHLISYPITANAVGAPQMMSQPVSDIFLCSPLPSGTWRTPGLSIPWCCLPTSFSYCLIFFPLSLYLARWFWPDLMNGTTCPYHCSLHHFMMVRRSLWGLTACWIFVNALQDDTSISSSFNLLEENKNKPQLWLAWTQKENAKWPHRCSTGVGGGQTSGSRVGSSCRE